MQEFTGNSDPATVKMNVLKIPVEAKVIRIVPKQWKFEIALKVQLFGCPVSHLSGKISNHAPPPLRVTTSLYFAEVLFDLTYAQQTRSEL